MNYPGYADGRTPVAMEQGGRIFYLSYDQVGSLRQVTDSSGRAVKVLEYDSFGNIIKDSAPGFFLPIGFAGGLLDRHTGLVRFGFRDYDCQIGRWTAKDPIGFAAGDVDLFGYVGNDPVNMIDLLGLKEVGIVFSAGIHAPTVPWPVAAGVNVSSVLLNPLSSSRRFEGRGITPEVVTGMFGGIGLSIGIDDLGVTGHQEGPTIGFGMGRYKGLQVIPRKEIDKNYGWLNPLRYASGIYFGKGLSLGFRLPTLITPFSTPAVTAPSNSMEEENLDGR